MGNRANFVIVDNQEWRLHYAHWTGCRMLDALAFGPETALRYVDSQRSCSKRDWLDPAWADGGAVIDLDRRRLLFFGDELMIGIPERRAMLQVLDTMWPGYAVRWAYDGLAELADYVGAELRVHDWPKRPTTKLARNRKELCQVVSVVDEDGRLRLWSLGWTVSQAWHGPTLLEELPGRGLTRLTLGVIPEGGVHVDVGRKTVGEWHTVDTMGICREMADRWPGWQAESWGDGFEEQADRCGRALRLPELDLTASADRARAWIQQRVYQSFADSPMGQIAKLAGLLSPLAPGLEVSADAIGGPGIRPGREEWARFVAACDAVGGGQAESA